ncbi:phage baseplate assembly protein V [Pectobacteriaceae bacterium C52]|nr:phage baseplate assembly protein V [Pectobacteriaceae bacterium C52]WJY13599.1 phage baseplate assembly protein V [Pectobacteriaceae bacterium CE90]WJY16363.1 phage baseplate assembly protein V [Pectobacteriaceae bacterium CE90]
MSNPLSVLQRSLSNLLARAVVTGLSTATKCQMLQIKMAADELKTDIEHIEPYGFTSAPHVGAEAVAVYMDGDRSHGVVLVVGDRRYRVTGLQAGEVAIYTDEGDSIVLKRGRVIDVTTKTFIVNATEKMTVNTPLLEVPVGDISDKKSTLQGVRDTFNGHDHPGDSGGTTGTPDQTME